MRKTLTTLAATLAILATPALAASGKLSGEERLAKMLDGRVAGKPVSCISLPNSGNLEVIDKTAIVYKMGGTIYVNRPADPKSLDKNDMLIIDRLSHQLCKTDMVQTRSQGPNSFFTGAVFLGDFVPYRKAEG
jgi:hypothetical protein